MRKTTQDFIASLLVLSISFFYMICTFRIRTTPIGNPHAPKVFPLILASMGIVLSLFLLGRSVIQRRLDTQHQKDTQGQNALSKTKSETTQLLLLALVASALGIGYAVLFEFLGYPLSTTLFLMAYMFFLNGRKRWRINGIVPLVFSVCVYIVFAMLLSVSLPLFPNF